MRQGVGTDLSRWILYTQKERINHIFFTKHFIDLDEDGSTPYVFIIDKLSLRGRNDDEDVVTLMDTMLDL